MPRAQAQQRGIPIRVAITDHALERWRQYVGVRSRSSLRHEVRRRLYAYLRAGAAVAPDGSVRVAMAEGLAAVCVPGEAGWTVVTFRPTSGALVQRGIAPRGQAMGEGAA
jgi:hypothetical protein